MTPPIANAVVNGQGFFTLIWYLFLNSLTSAIADLTSKVKGLGGGLTLTITTAKLTGGGATGSMTYTNGVLTASVQAT